MRANFFGALFCFEVFFFFSLAFISPSKGVFGSKKGAIRSPGRELRTEMGKEWRGSFSDFFLYEIPLIISLIKIKIKVF